MRIHSSVLVRTQRRNKRSEGNGEVSTLEVRGRRVDVAVGLRSTVFGLRIV